MLLWSSKTEITAKTDFSYLRVFQHNSKTAGCLVSQTSFPTDVCHIYLFCTLTDLKYKPLSGSILQ